MITHSCLEHVARSIRKQISIITGRHIKSIRNNTFLYKIGQKVPGLCFSRNDVIDILGILAKGYGFKVILRPNNNEDIKLLKHTDLTIGGLAAYVKRKLDSEGIYISRRGVAYKVGDITQALDEVDGPAPDDLKVVDVNEDIVDTVVDKEKGIKASRHKSGVMFAMMDSATHKGTIVSLIDNSGTPYYVSSARFSHINKNLLLANDICYASIFDEEEIAEAFNIENGVMEVREDCELGIIVNKMVSFTINTGWSCNVKLIPVCSESNTQSFEFGPSDPMADIDAKMKRHLTIEQYAILKAKMNEN